MHSQTAPTGSTGNQSTGSQPSPTSQAHADWAAAYDLLRPTGELDSRAKQVLITALALIALCLARQKPDSIDVLGFTFRADDWLVLAIPLAVVLAYAVVQLCLVWFIEKWKRAHAMFQPVSSLRQGWYSMLAAKQQNAEDVVATTVEMNRRRAEIWQRYRAQSKELSRRNPMRTNPDGFDKIAMLQWHEEENLLEQQLNEELKNAGVTAFDQEVNTYLGGVVAGRQDPENAVADQALSGMRRLKWLRTARVVLDLCIPLAIAFTAFVVLILTVFYPSVLVSAHFGSSLPRGK